jgi:uncharacterized protein YxjI
LGRVKREFSLLRRIYTVYDNEGVAQYQLFGPILHPWTFEIRKGDEVFGKITKRWSGLGTEMFTDADTFAITFPQEWSPYQKAVFFGAVFLIDFMYFENSGKSRN